MICVSTSDLPLAGKPLDYPFGLKELTNKSFDSPLQIKSRRRVSRLIASPSRLH